MKRDPGESEEEYVNRCRAKMGMPPIKTPIVGASMPGAYSTDSGMAAAFTVNDGHGTIVAINGHLSEKFFMTVVQLVPGEPEPKVVLEIPRDILAWIDSLKASVREIVESEIRAAAAVEIRRVVREELGADERRQASASNIESDLKDMGFDADK